MLEERRRIQRLIFGIAERASDDETLTAAGDGDVTKVAFVAETLPLCRAEVDVLFLQVGAVGVGQQTARRGRSRKNAFVQTEDAGEFDLGIARAIDRADEDLIQRGR